MISNVFSKGFASFGLLFVCFAAVHCGSPKTSVTHRDAASLEEEDEDLSINLAYSRFQKLSSRKQAAFCNRHPYKNYCERLEGSKEEGSKPEEATAGTKPGGNSSEPKPEVKPAPAPAPAPMPEPSAPVASAFLKANMTNFESYPDPGSEECVAYNGCTWAGQFAALDGKQPLSWVKENNIAAVHSKDFAKYRLKTLRVKSGSRQIDVKVYDMCSDSDCNGCCTANAKGTGFLLDLEKYTAERFGVKDGVVEWTCLDCK